MKSDKVTIGLNPKHIEGNEDDWDYNFFHPQTDRPAFTCRHVRFQSFGKYMIETEVLDNREKLMERLKMFANGDTESLTDTDWFVRENIHKIKQLGSKNCIQCVKASLKGLHGKRTSIYCLINRFTWAQLTPVLLQTDKGTDNRSGYAYEWKDVPLTSSR